MKARKRQAGHHVGRSGPPPKWGADDQNPVTKLVAKVTPEAPGLKCFSEMTSFEDVTPALYAVETSGLCSIAWEQLNQGLALSRS